MLEEKGAFHIDFDQLAHAVEAPDQPAWQQIVDFFGSGILHPDRTIDRAKLGAIVFEDKEKLARLNGIVHPAVFDAWRRRIEEIKKIKPDAIILSDVPLLIEAGMQSLVDLVLLVYISPGEQLDRLIKRNGYSQDEAQRRLASQMSIEGKLPHAQVVINNQGNIEETRQVIDWIWQELLEREKRQKA